MYIIESRIRGFECGRIYEKAEFETNEDGSYRAYTTLGEAVEAARQALARYMDRDWDWFKVSDFPANPNLGAWYKTAERYNDDYDLRVIEVRVG